MDDIPDMKILNVGCGPTLSNTFAASRKANYIVLSDLLESNRQEIKKVLHEASDAADCSFVAQMQAYREGYL